MFVQYPRTDNKSQDNHNNIITSINVDVNTNRRIRRYEKPIGTDKLIQCTRRCCELHGFHFRYEMKCLTVDRREYTSLEIEHGLSASIFRQNLEEYLIKKMYENGVEALL